ncbi:MAG: AAA family ATPase [Comamonadaceae bacterium]|nr:AAA family ATPase [Comamonadaceae bacterium]
MRLNQIKLAGFKSFAEPTTFQLPGQRVGVVGPNGCGKSNIMDAVRWVLGESKASELRGESMQDVIFNGSGQRKPAGRASVELVFDNTAARAGGQWNSFAEIAVKRVLDARRHVQLLHQQPAGAPARRAGRLPRHRPGAARLRDHRPGHDQPHHREPARGAAPVPRGGRRRQQVQGAPPRDREPAEGHAREPDRASRTSCASSTPTSTSSRRRPRSPPQYRRAAGRRHDSSCTSSGS